MDTALHPSVSTVVYAFAASLLCIWPRPIWDRGFTAAKAGTGFRESASLGCTWVFRVTPFLTVDPKVPLPALLRLVLGVVAVFLYCRIL